MKHCRALFFSLVLPLALAGCDGDSGPSAGEPVSSDQPVVILMTGDSTQVGVPPFAVGVVTPPSVDVQRILREETGNGRIDVLNQGVGGTTSAQLLDGTDGYGMTWAQRLAVVRPNIVFNNHGINSSWAPAVPLEEYRAELTALVRQAQAAGAQFILETPLPVLEDAKLPIPFDFEAHAAKIQAVRELAAQTGAVLCDTNQAVRDAGYATLEHFPDGMHPNPEVYHFLGAVAAECAKPLLMPLGSLATP